MNPPTIWKILVLSVLAATVVACGAPASTDDAAEAAPAAAPQPAPAPPAPPAPAPPAPSAQTRQPAAERPAPAAPVVREAPAASPAPVERVETYTPPPPEPVTMTLPAGTLIDVAFVDSVASNESQVGDPVRVRVVDDIVQDGVAVIPAGSVVAGTVTEAVPLKKKIGGKARLGVEFTTLELPSGRTASIHTSFAEVGKSETKKDAATIGGATAGGAILGRMIEDDDKGKGTLIGAVVGAAAGTAIAAKTQGEEIVILSGTQASLRLDQPAHVTVIP